MARSRGPSGEHDEVLRRITAVVRELEQTGARSASEPFSTQLERLEDAVEEIGKAWSGSPIGRHSLVYISGLRPVRPGEYFDREWGFEGSEFVSRTRGEWAEFSFEEVRRTVYERAGVDTRGFDEILAAAHEAQKAFRAKRTTLDALLRALLGKSEDAHLRELTQRVSECAQGPSASDFGKAMLPSQYVTRDSSAAMEGRKLPPHLTVKAQCQYARAQFMSCENLAVLANAVLDYLRTKYQLEGTTTLKNPSVVFVGHGHSSEYLKVVRFLENRLGLQTVFYESEPAAGRTTQERVEEMKDAAHFAFLLFTCEDAQAGGGLRARQNVVQEYGVMEAHLGRERAIILREDDCELPSNNTNVNFIPFPKGHVEYAFEQIREVLEGAGLI